MSEQSSTAMQSPIAVIWSALRRKDAEKIKETADAHHEVFCSEMLAIFRFCLAYDQSSPTTTTTTTGSLIDWFIDHDRRFDDRSEESGYAFITDNMVRVMVDLLVDSRYDGKVKLVEWLPFRVTLNPWTFRVIFHEACAAGKLELCKALYAKYEIMLRGLYCWLEPIMPQFSFCCNDRLLHIAIWLKETFDITLEEEQEALAIKFRELCASGDIIAARWLLSVFPNIRDCVKVGGVELRVRCVEDVPGAIWLLTRVKDAFPKAEEVGRDYPSRYMILNPMFATNQLFRVVTPPQNRGTDDP